MAFGRNKTLVIILIISVNLPFLTNCKKADPENKPAWAKKDIRDYSDADLERLYDQWEEDDEPLPPDELPEHMKPPSPGNNIPLDKIGEMSPDNLMKMTKKGKTVMMFVSLAGNPTKQECETITSLWQTSLRNNHIQAERYVIEDTRAIFLFHDGAQAWDAKEFILEQNELKEMTLEGQVYQGKGSTNDGTPPTKGNQKEEL